jgi:L-iditol 2-dehydrogenase
MRILQFNGPWDFSVEEIDMPTPGENEVLVKSESVGICGSDVHGFTGESGRRKDGMVMGHEAVGKIVAVGIGVTTLVPGQRVAIFPISGCGTCEYCTKGSEHLCPDKRIIGVSAGRWGAMADFYICHAHQAFPLADGSDPDVGLFAEPLAVATHAVRFMDATADSPVAIVGAGTIGLAIALVLRDRGSEKIFALDKVTEKLEVAREIGAWPINVTESDPADVIENRLGHRRVRGVFEAVGAAQTVRAAYDLCDFGGTVVLVGNLAREFTLPLQGITSNEITLRGSYGFSRADFAEAIRLVSKYQRILQHLVSGVCSLEETPAIMTKLAKGERQAIKIVIHP